MTARSIALSVENIMSNQVFVVQSDLAAGGRKGEGMNNELIEIIPEPDCELCEHGFTYSDDKYIGCHLDLQGPAENCKSYKHWLESEVQP